MAEELSILKDTKQLQIIYDREVGIYVAVLIEEFPHGQFLYVGEGSLPMYAVFKLFDSLYQRWIFLRSKQKRTAVEQVELMILMEWLH